MRATSRAFKANAHEALVDATLQKALGIMKSGFQVRYGWDNLLCENLQWFEGFYFCHVKEDMLDAERGHLLIICQGLIWNRWSITSIA